jgi:hypothetical protein
LSYFVGLALTRDHVRINICSRGQSVPPSPEVVNESGRQYDVAPDGRFLINTELDTAAAPITLLQNWTPPEP